MGSGNINKSRYPSIIFISFDTRKNDYPSMTYSIASIIASLKPYPVKISHYSVDLQHALEEKGDKESTTDAVIRKLDSLLPFFVKFDFIALSFNSWSKEYCHYILDKLVDFNGHVILGGYEVTSWLEKDLVETFPGVDYFIKGYAEKLLRKIIAEEYEPQSRVLNENSEQKDLASPYLSGVLPLYSRKIHWETKRGCPFKCGFCEWGNATKKVFEIDQRRLDQELNLFKNSSVEEINILDGTFNFRKNYLRNFKKLLAIEGLKITCQARFENLVRDSGQEFLRLCSENNERIHLEFGLQTIHKKEMETIGRTNTLNQIQQALQLLHKNEIDFEVSIIYAIPGQTVESFIDTIEFLITNGCRTIKAYPLSIPKNSDMHNNKSDMCVQEGTNKFNVASVVSSYSFPVEQRKDMDSIADRLNNRRLLMDMNTDLTHIRHNNSFVLEQVSDYQWKILKVNNLQSANILFDLILSDYLSITLSDLDKDDVMQSMIATGKTISHANPKNRLAFVNEVLSGKFSFELKKSKIGKSEDPLINKVFNRINPNLEPKKFICEARVSISGNMYVFRKIMSIK